MAHFGYILQSQSTGAYYVGQTNSLQERIASHNKGEVQSTRPGRPWKLVYSKEFAARSQAVSWERMVKSRKKRKFIEELIHSERSAAR